MEKKQHGGKRPGAGRPTKADEEKLILKLSALDDDAFKCLENGIKEGNYQFWNKFMEFRYGKPKERMDITTDDESLNIPIINFVKSGS